MRKLWRMWWGSALNVRFSDLEIRVATSVACGFNIVGWPIELAIMRGYPNAPLWPVVFTETISAIILTALLSGYFHGKRRLVSTLFVFHVACIAAAIYVLHPSFLSDPHWVPFQINKLGALVAGLFAPGFIVGIASLAFMVGSPVVQFMLWPPEIKAQLGPAEPWAMIAFGVASVFVLLHRLRVRDLETRARLALAEAETEHRLAKAFLDLRDQMNTPLQTIEIATTLLKKGKDDALFNEVLARLQKAARSLADVSRGLKRFEASLERKEP